MSIRTESPSRSTARSRLREAAQREAERCPLLAAERIFVPSFPALAVFFATFFATFFAVFFAFCAAVLGAEVKAQV